MKTSVSRFSRLFVGGLVAAWLTMTALPASAQTHQRTTPSGQPIGFAPKRQQTMHLVARKSQPDIIEGATYMENAQGQLILQEDGVVPPGGTVVEGDGPVFQKGGGVPLGFVEGGCVDGSCDTGCMTPCNFIPSGNLEFFAGVQGFTGPANRGGQGSFGFHQGVNWGIPLPGIGTCLGAQVGFRATQSNISGSSFTNESRNQSFLTAGLFRRVDCGLQGGVVIDWLSDRWYRDADLTQLRGELSWVFNPQHDLGFRFTASSTAVTVTSVVDGVNITESWQPTNLNAFFYRWRFDSCAEGYCRVFGGWSDEGDGLLGADGRLPLSSTWALETGFAYLVPSEGVGTGINAGHAQESWNLGISLVWYPGITSRNPYATPLFRVADNGNFMVDGF